MIRVRESLKWALKSKPRASGDDPWLPESPTIIRL